MVLWFLWSASVGLGNVTCVYLLTLVLTALRVTQPPCERRSTSFAVLVPAHNEEANIGPTVRALRSMDYPEEMFEVLVVADNCDDATAAVARAAGATVWGRDAAEEQRGGKGAALEWGISRVLRERAVDAVAIVDADCAASSNLLAALAGGLESAPAAQASNVVANPETPVAALRFAGFALMNTARPLGKQALGLSSGLFGTGMAFKTDWLAEHPWRASGLAEDAEYHLAVVRAGGRAAFCPTGSVSSPMPATHADAASQQRRWEGGRLELAGSIGSVWTDGLRRRDPVRLHAAAEMLVPPQSLLAALSAVGIAAAGLLRSRAALMAAAGTLLLQAACVAGALRVANAPASVYRALPRAGPLILRKLWIYAELALGRRPRSWVRTGR